MNESDARRVLLLQALETPPGLDQWQEEDRDWASRQAVAQLGEQAGSEQFITRRAALAIERLSGRTPLIPRLLASVTWRGWILPALLVVAFLVGLLADAVSANRQINILAPPLLALLVWNLAVYLVIVANALLSRRGQAAGRVADRAADRTGPPPGRPAGPLTRLLARLAGATAGGRHDPGLAPSLGHFIDDWLRASSALTTARAHACRDRGRAAAGCAGHAALPVEHGRCRLLPRDRCRA